MTVSCKRLFAKFDQKGFLPVLFGRFQGVDYFISLQDDIDIRNLKIELAEELDQIKTFVEPIPRFFYFNNIGMTHVKFARFYLAKTYLYPLDIYTLNRYIKNDSKFCR